MNAFPYRVSYGWTESNHAYFRDFAPALALARVLEAFCREPSRNPGYSYSVSISNTERADGSEDGNQTGLTDEEKEQWL